MPRLLPIGLVLAGVLNAGCTVAPISSAAQAAPSLGFRRLVAEGVAAVAGQVRAPAALLADRASLLEAVEAGAAPRLNELPVPNARITVLDPQGQPIPGLAPIRADQLGRFAIGQLDSGRRYVIEASFEDRQGRKRTLRALADPTALGGCMAVDLASTLVATRLRALDAPALEPGELAQMVTTARDRLPSVLDAENAHQAELGGQAAKVLNDLTDDDTSASGAVAEHIIGRDPVLQTAWQTVGAASLEVGFTIQALPENQATILRPERLSRPISGQIELVYRQEGGAAEAVSFWLNNERVADGVVANGTWIATFDTTRVPDGPYVLSAIGESSASSAPFRARAFVYIDNARAIEGSPCGAEGGT